MDRVTKSYFENLESNDKNVQYEAYKNILAATEEKVAWSYEVWDELKEGLTHPDHHKRSRSAQFLSNLAISDPEKRMLKDFPSLWEVTKDQKFVTARHSIQSVWRVGLAGYEQKELVFTHLVDRFKNCVEEKNYTLIRYDILQGLRNLYDEGKDEDIKQNALALIETEEESKYQKKYLSLWRN
ncbi:hypothetical protein [Alteribacter populi]|uniref:hypothetical protein n=1 Tax=Alteribacter populi TaxID=2011011 RepID=UPI000BBAC203|nr:hypothetical protein [Alteribacter populi]